MAGETGERVKCVLQFRINRLSVSREKCLPDGQDINFPLVFVADDALALK